jgi:hypothetical protein
LFVLVSAHALKFFMLMGLVGAPFEFYVVVDALVRDWL